MLLAEDASYCEVVPEILYATVGDLGELSAAADRLLKKIADDSRNSIEAARALVLAGQFRDAFAPWRAAPSGKPALDVLPMVGVSQYCGLALQLHELYWSLSPWAQTGAVMEAHLGYEVVLDRLRDRMAGKEPPKSAAKSSALVWLLALAALGGAGYAAWRYRSHLFPRRQAAVNP